MFDSFASLVEYDRLVKSQLEETLGQGQEEVVYESLEWSENIHGHRTLKAPHPVRSAKLTRVPLS